MDLAKCGLQPRDARSANLEALAGIVGRATCAAFCAGRAAEKNRIWFVGTAKHCEVAEYMLATLQRNLQKIAKDSYEAVYAEDNGNAYRTKGYIGSFKAGFLRQLEARYAEERAKVIAETDAASGTCTALVRLNNTLTRVDSWISEHVRGRVGSVRGRSATNSVGLAHGQAAANRISLKANAVKGGGARRQIGGA